MTAAVALFLLHDAAVNGAIYALIGVSIVLAFATTRIIWVGQGEMVAFGALTFASLEQGQTPGAAKLLLTMAVLASLIEFASTVRESSIAKLARSLATDLGPPLALFFIVDHISGLQLPSYANALLSIALTAPLSPLTYRIAFQPLAQSSILVLLIAAIGVHMSLLGLGLLFFGPEGMSAKPLVSASVVAGPLIITGQAILMVTVAIFSMIGLWLVVTRSRLGLVLQASAVNRKGARLIGISLPFTGRIAFWLTGIIGAVSGVLISSTTTVYYDSGFAIGLKGFIAAVMGGMLSYPVAVASALMVGIVEAFSSFWISAYKDSIVFALLIPFLLIYSLGANVLEEHDE